MVLTLKFLQTILRPFPYLDIPKKEWNKYLAPYKDTVNCVLSRNIEVHTVDPVVPESYIEKMPFPAKVKEHSIIASVVNKSTKKSIKPDEHDRKSTRLNSSHSGESRMPSSA